MRPLHIHQGIQNNALKITKQPRNLKTKNLKRDAQAPESTGIGRVGGAQHYTLRKQALKGRSSPKLAQKEDVQGAQHHTKI